MNNIGIYKITNTINQKIYIGQSCRLHERWLEHLRAGQPEKYKSKNERDNNSSIHKAMQKYGIENFTFEILEYCDKNLLDLKEQEWIQYYNSNIKEIGYNLTKSGQKNFVLKGENHGQAKFTQKEIDEIITLLKQNILSYNEISKKYNISKPMLSNINLGKNWKKDSEKYPLRKTSYAVIGNNHTNAVLNDKLVIEIRNKYSEGMSIKQILLEYRYINENTIKACLWGRTWKHLPIWNKKEKKWIEPVSTIP